MRIILNGQPREVGLDPQTATVEGLVNSLEIKPDRIAVEQNGEIVRRPDWGSARVQEGDRFEMVHFVGGGL